MLLLEWRITLIALLLLPLFVIPAKRVGRRLQAMTRESFDLNASMNTTMTERFGVSGALLVKLFGRHDDEADEFSARAGRVRDIGVRTAMYSRTFLTALGPRRCRRHRDDLPARRPAGAVRGAITLGTLVAMGTFVAQIYAPLTALTNARVDVMTAFVSFDRVFEVLDAPNPIEDRPDAVVLERPAGRGSSSTACGSATRRRPRSRSQSLEADVDAPLAERGVRAGPAGHRPRGRGGPDRRPRRPVGRRQDDARPSSSPGSTTRPSAPCASTATTSATSPRTACARPSAWSARTRTCSTTPWAPTCATPGPTRPTPSSRRRAGPPASTTSSPRCPTATTRSSASAGTGCRAARSSGWPSPACC